MKLKFFKKIGAMFVALTMLVMYVPAFAASGGIEINLTDVTESDPTTLTGESKIMVSVSGAEGEFSMAQIYLEFDGDLKYKSVNFLTGENNPPECALISPNPALANNKKEIMPSIVCPLSPISLKEDGATDLFVLTFAGEAGDKATLKIDDLDRSFLTINGQDMTPSAKEKVLPSLMIIIFASFTTEASNGECVVIIIC